MKPDNLEARLKAIRLTTSPSLDARVMESLRAASADAGKGGSEPARSDHQTSATPRTRLRRFMRPAGIIAAAAAILVAMILWLTSGTNPQMAAYAALAEAARNSKAAQWVSYHASIMGMSVDGWISSRPARFATKAAGCLTYRDQSTGKVYFYDTASKTITVEDVSGETSASDDAASLFDAVMEEIESIQEKGVKVARTSETIDGKLLCVYSFGGTSAVKNARITIDPSERKIVKMEIGVSPGTGLNFPVAMTMAYPAGGPADIYELGAPRDTRVVHGAFKEASLLYRKAEAAQEAFAPSYFAVIYTVLEPKGSAAPVKNVGDISVVYRKGSRYRINRYSGEAADMNSALAPYDNMASFEAWTASHSAQSALFCDTSLETEDDPERPAAVKVTLTGAGTVTRTAISSLWKKCTVDGVTWLKPLTIAPGQPGMHLLPPKEGLGGTMAGVESIQLVSHGDDGEAYPERTARILDPQRDYAVEESITARYPASADISAIDTSPVSIESTGIFEHVESRRITEYAQTPAGQWYAKMIVTEVADGKTGRRTETTRVLIDTARGIPDSAFDIAKLEEQYRRTPK